MLLEYDIVMTPGHSIAGSGLWNIKCDNNEISIRFEPYSETVFFSHLAFHIGYIFKTKNYFYATLLPEHSQLIQTMITKKIKRTLFNSILKLLLGGNNGGG